METTEIERITDTILKDADQQTIDILSEQLKMCNSDLRKCDEMLKHYRSVLSDYNAQVMSLTAENMKLAEELNHIKTNVPVNEYAYYYVSNSINEYGAEQIVPKYFHTLDEAKEELKEHSDWYCAKGTGRIYGVKFTIPVTTQIVFEKR